MGWKLRLFIAACSVLQHQIIGQITTPTASSNITTTDLLNDNETTLNGISTTQLQQATTPVVTLATPLASAAPTAAPATAVDSCSETSNEVTLFCTCDISQSVCDVNCCCDRDCNAQDRATFTFSYDNAPSDNLEVCVKSSWMFRRPVRLQSLTSSRDLQQYESDGNTCWVMSNYGVRNTVTVPDTKETENDFQEATQNRFSFNLMSGPLNEVINAVNYKQGDIIQIRTSANTFSHLLLPFATSSTSTCLDGNPAIFLQGSSFVCVRSLPQAERDIAALGVDCMSEEYLDPVFYLTAGRVLSLPTNTSSSSVDPDNLISVSGPYDEKFYDRDTQTCNNTVSQVTYTIYHRGGIISAVEVNFVQIDLSSSSLAQTFGVRYSENLTSAAMEYSGNPGYVVGKLVRSGWCCGSVGDQSIIETSDEIQLSLLASSPSGECDESVPRHPIMFGHNTRVGCLINNTRDPFSAEVRRSLRGASLNASVHIAAFGNTSPSTPGDWVPLLPPEIPPTTFHIGLEMIIDILYARVGSLEEPQNRIIGAQMSYNLIASPDPYNATVDPELDFYTIESVVTFTDVTRSKDVEVPPSVYSQRVDTEFFYPFIYASQSPDHL